MSMLFMALALCFGFASCGDDDDEPDSTPAATDFTNFLPGHWANANVASNVTETLSFNYNGEGTIMFYDLVDNDWGVVASGTYTLSGSKLTASYNKVEVTDEDYNSATYHGFTDGKSKKVTYTIQSCDGKKLVMTDNSGKSLSYEKYADLK